MISWVWLSGDWRLACQPAEVIPNFRRHRLWTPQFSQWHDSPVSFSPSPATSILSTSPHTSDSLHVRPTALYTASLAVPRQRSNPPSVTKYPDNSSWFSSHPRGNFTCSISKLAHTPSKSLFTDNSIIPYYTSVRLQGVSGGSERRKYVTAEVFFFCGPKFICTNYNSSGDIRHH